MVTGLSLKTDVGTIAPQLMFRPSVPEPGSEKKGIIPWELQGKIKTSKISAHSLISAVELYLEFHSRAAHDLRLNLCDPTRITLHSCAGHLSAGGGKVRGTPSV